MTKLPSYFVTVSLAVASIIIFTAIPSSHALGSGGTLAVVGDGSATVCGIVAGELTRRIECYRRGRIIAVLPNISFSSISGGRSYFCGLSSSNYSLLCWGTVSSTDTFQSKRLYNNPTVPLENLAIGDAQICTTLVGNGKVECWRTNREFQLPSRSYEFVSISSGSGFSCGILRNSSRVRCWGNMSIANQIQSEFGNSSMWSLVAGDSHVCGLNSNGFLVCKGSNSSGQLNAPHGGPWKYSGLALGAEHSCAIRRSNGSVVCWGGRGQFSVNLTQRVSFEVIVSGSNFTCGVTRSNLSIMCWGPGWFNSTPDSSTSRFELPLPPILPGPCVQSSCTECGIYPGSQYLCPGFGNICKPCLPQISLPPPRTPLPPQSPPPFSSPSSRSKTLTRGLLGFAVVGSVGILAAVCAIIYGLYTGICFGKKKIHNSVQPTITKSGSSNNGGANSNGSPHSSLSTAIKRQGSAIMRRQRSGTSSTKHADKAEEFTLPELITAANNFSPENKIGSGSFGVVYRGKLADGRDVAIKRGETNKKFQEKETAFESELSFLSRLHHKHLVRLVGFCEDKHERLLVYEYMKNGALHDHLHDKNNIVRSSSVVNSWSMRIKIALDASRGIEYLHNYAVPPIIHRDIKSSNILLDANWTARVSDFGLSLMGPEFDHYHRPKKAAGTVGYIDPEYYSLNVLTAKSDVYGFGVVLLELLTGKRAIFKNGENGNTGTPVSVVEFAVPAIMAEELERVLDVRVGPPEKNEAEAVELVAYTAMRCVSLEGKDRPTMGDIVANLERALALCDASHGGISSGTISTVSE